MDAVLDTLRPELRDAIREVGVERTYEAGQSVFKLGDAGVAFYIIKKGKARVHADDLELNRLGEGDAFGEIAGLGGMDRTASVTAEERLTVLRVERQALYEAVRDQPEALLGLVTMLCERESGMADRVTSRSWQLHLARQELEIGRTIQSGFLPDSMPEITGYEIAGHFQAARVVAGDFYDAFYIPAIKRLALVIGDVCDKGVGAALFMTLFRSLIRATAQSRTFMSWAVDAEPGNACADGQDCATLARETLANTIALTNNYIATTHGKTSMFASVFVALLEPESGVFHYINAGHEEAYIVGAKGVPIALPPDGPVLGLFPGAGHAIGQATLEPGETLLVYTDGVPEATNRAGEQYTDERLRALITSWPGGAESILEAIAQSVAEFSEGARQHDDITMLASYRKTV